ncbi:hypothetical protein HMPREF3158_08870 [Corynebacterium sp. HMSC06G04]|uniref:hypothetical protein n=1 Tax=Corynebacterium sp. HMSC06G04 TaxID=1581126 RepID=UPI0008A1A240|nr:hypothetical protein [Corynebacterium sp. HMSC06G04]OFT46107.1 hypothetical protein HMPREF3158_08870 [Corynebacterium sp. HMSC06G04]
MRVAIFDGIQEEHLASSLERSFRKRGHQVLNTGRFGSGFKFPTAPSALALLERNAQQVVDFQPDLILVFRPASAPESVLRKLKATGANVFAWLCDDPVLWELSYRTNSHMYDALLHCGDVDVIELYDKHLGHPGGINFPFWTDNTAFPYVYGNAGFDSDLVFLGNAQGQLRRKRYHDLAGLSLNVKMHGLTGLDYANLNHGYLDSDREVIESCGRAKMAVSFPQYFRDHKGLDTWFEGLADFEFFPFPSRVIQYAAMGLPTICVVPSVEKIRHFPELIPVPSIDAVDKVFSEFSESDLIDLSLATAERFAENFSADSRVLCLEAMMESDEWRDLSSVERSQWFTKFDGRELKVKGYSSDPGINTSTFDFSKALEWYSGESPSLKRSVVLHSFVKEDDLSLGNILSRGLKELGITVDKPGTKPQSKSTHFWILNGRAEITKLDSPLTSNSVVFFLDGNLDCTDAEFSTIAGAHKFVVRTAHAKQALTLAGADDADVLIYPWLYEFYGIRKFLRVGGAKRADRKLLVVESAGTATVPRSLSSDLKYYDGDVRWITVGSGVGLDELAAELSGCTDVLVGPTKIGRTNFIPDWFGYLILTDCEVYYARTLPKFSPIGLGERYFSVGEPGELIRKAERLRLKVHTVPFGREVRKDVASIDQYSVKKLLLDLGLLDSSEFSPGTTAYSLNVWPGECLSLANTFSLDELCQLQDRYGLTANAHLTVTSTSEAMETIRNQLRVTLGSYPFDWAHSIVFRKEAKISIPLDELRHTFVTCNSPATIKLAVSARKNDRSSRKDRLPTPRAVIRRD